MRYIPNSPEQIREMLAAIGVESVEALFRTIPAQVKLQGGLPIPPGQSELEIERYFYELGRLNDGVLEYKTFLGAGAYNHYVPAAIDAVISRAEFYTAYTPYQPEVSQGTLQAIFEYQTMVSQLTGMEVTNASMYDGATAVTEAVLMAHRVRTARKTVVAGSLHPFYRQVLRTYVANFEIDIVEVPWTGSGRVDMAALAAQVDGDTAAVVIQSPNFFGIIEDLAAVAELAHAKKALLVAAFTEALSLPLLKAPGSCGADIVAGEGQSFGIPLSFGGPYLGIFSTSLQHVRRMPGRVVGMTEDTRGQRGFVLTLSTREQHIRREKATSNICTNQGLCALMASVYLAYAGKSGLQEAAAQNAAKARFAAKRLTEVPGVTLKFSSPFFNEFVLSLPGDPHAFARFCKERKIVPGVPLKWFYPELTNELLVCVTEVSPAADIEALAGALHDFTGGSGGRC
jgi:glycine dehydrogenase subunit 1